MRLSQLFGHTLRNDPSDAEVDSHRLLVRSGYIRQLGSGIFSYLHLAVRSMQKIEAILRDEMNKIGGQEILMPMVHPAEIWKETGRWYQIGSEMGRFQDKNNHDMVLAMTHEEVVADLVKKEVRSFRDLPRLIYHIQTKWRDDPRPRAGLIRAREFTMKDSYSLDADNDGLDKQYRAHYQAYINIFKKCGLTRILAVSSDPGMMGGNEAHEFMYPTPIGEDTLLICDICGYVANRQVARVTKTPSQPEELRSISKVSTPGCKTIEALASYLSIPKSKTAKAVFFVASMFEDNSLIQKFVFSVIRGDMELNEAKLLNSIGAYELRPATEDEIRLVGAVPGYASPISLISSKSKNKPTMSSLIIIDDSIVCSPNLVTGGNEIDVHLLNTNYPRDYNADLITDLVAANEGDSCPGCCCGLRAVRGVELGNIFKLGSRYSNSLGCKFLDRDGSYKPVIMGSYGIGVGRLLACIAEEHHDEYGLLWPITVSPYQVHLIKLSGENPSGIDQITNNLYSDLQDAGLEILYDDREESPGVKFTDADLIGIPIRVTISSRSLSQGGVEIKMRHEKEKHIIPLDEICPYVLSSVNSLQGAISDRLALLVKNAGSNDGN